jgi:hypothetical protein
LVSQKLSNLDGSVEPPPKSNLNLFNYVLDSIALTAMNFSIDAITRDTKIFKPINYQTTGLGDNSLMEQTPHYFLHFLVLSLILSLPLIIGNLFYSFS